MTDYLFVTWDGGGNVPPALALAARLRELGDTVRVLGHPTLHDSVTELGLEFVPYATVERFSAVEQNSLPRLIALFTDRRLADDVRAEVSRRPTDVVVVDCLLLPALGAAAATGLTVVSLEHLFDGYLRGGWARSPIGWVARVRGVAPRRQWDAADLALVASLPSLDPGYAVAHRGNRVWVGPFVEPLPAARDWSGTEPSLLVSLSTFRYPGMDKALQGVLDAVGLTGIPAVVTTGPAIDPRGLHAPRNAQVHRYVPHDRVMPGASLLVGHGGHSTTMRAIAHELPMLLMPMHPLLDQPVVARAVAAAGAGRAVSRRVSPQALAEAITALAGDGPHRAAVARLGAEVRSAGGLDTAVALLQRFGGVARGSTPQQP